MKHLGWTVAICVMCLASPARAELVATPVAPTFSSEEQATITRNATLAQHVRTSPWLVRHVLDLMARTRGATGTDTRTLPPDPSFDPRRNPDLDRLHRSSPEAALDLFRLLEAAGRR